MVLLQKGLQIKKKKRQKKKKNEYLFFNHKPLIKTLTYGEQMVQGLPIQAKYQHH
jgi:hypothetical protein